MSTQGERVDGDGRSRSTSSTRSNRSIGGMLKSFRGSSKDHGKAKENVGPASAAADPNATNLLPPMDMYDAPGDVRPPGAPAPKPASPAAPSQPSRRTPPQKVAPPLRPAPQSDNPPARPLGSHVEATNQAQSYRSHHNKSHRSSKPDNPSSSLRGSSSSEPFDGSHSTLQKKTKLEKIHELKAQNKELRRAARSLKMELSQAQMSVQAMEGSTRAMMDNGPPEVQKLEKELEEVKQKNSLLEEDLEEALGDIDKMVEQIDADRSTVERLTEERKSDARAAAADIEMLEDQVGKKQEEIETLKSELEETKDGAAEKDEERKALREELDELKVALDEDLGALRSELDDLRAADAEKDDEIEALRDELKESKAAAVAAGALGTAALAATASDGEGTDVTERQHTDREATAEAETIEALQSELDELRAADAEKGREIEDLRAELEESKAAGEAVEAVEALGTAAVLAASEGGEATSEEQTAERDLVIEDRMTEDTVTKELEAKEEQIQSLLVLMEKQANRIADLEVDAKKRDQERNTEAQREQVEQWLSVGSNTKEPVSDQKDSPTITTLTTEQVEAMQKQAERSMERLDSVMASLGRLRNTNNNGSMSTMGMEDDDGVVVADVAMLDTKSSLVQLEAAISVELIELKFRNGLEHMEGLGDDETLKKMQRLRTESETLLRDTKSQMTERITKAQRDVLRVESEIVLSEEEEMTLSLDRVAAIQKRSEAAVEQLESLVTSLEQKRAKTTDVAGSDAATQHANLDIAISLANKTALIVVEISSSLDLISSKLMKGLEFPEFEGELDTLEKIQTLMSQTLLSLRDTEANLAGQVSKLSKDIALVKSELELRDREEDEVEEAKEEVVDPVVATINSAFRGAYTNATIVEKAKALLVKYGYEGPDTSLLASSLCNEESAWALQQDLSVAFGKEYAMGGPCGFSFGGVVSFRSMLDRIPKGGICLIVFGPHVGIDEGGKAGCNPDGNGGKCCRIATSAASYVKDAPKWNAESPLSSQSPNDSQQAFVGSMLMPYGNQLEDADDPDVKLPMVLFDVHDEMMKQIVSEGCKEYEGEAKIVLLGGVQINTPAGWSDYFLPMTFEVRDSDGKLVENFLDESERNTVVSKVEKSFPGALTNAALVQIVKISLSQYGYGVGTLLASSLCSDDIARALERDLCTLFENHFSMGGLAGFAFGTIASFEEMVRAIPPGESCLVVYGPHVGVDSDGNVGKVNYHDDGSSVVCCSGAAAAATFVSNAMQAGGDALLSATDSSNAEHAYVGSIILKNGERLENANDPNVELPMALFDVQDEQMKMLATEGCREIVGEGKITLLGGIQINTPNGCPDYFFPITFEVRDKQGQVLESLCDSQEIGVAGVNASTSPENNVLVPIAEHEDEVESDDGAVAAAALSGGKAAGMVMADVSSSSRGRDSTRDKENSGGGIGQDTLARGGSARKEDDANRDRSKSRPRKNLGIGQGVLKSFRKSKASDTPKSATHTRKQSAVKSFTVDIPATDDLGIECEGKPPKITHIDSSSPLADKLKVGQTICGVTFANKPGFHNVAGSEMPQFLKDTSHDNGRTFIVKEDIPDAGDRHEKMESDDSLVAATAMSGGVAAGIAVANASSSSRGRESGRDEASEDASRDRSKSRSRRNLGIGQDVFRSFRKSDKGKAAASATVDQTARQVAHPRHASVPLIKVKIPATESLGIAYNGKPPKLTRVNELSPIVDKVQVGQIICGVTAEGKQGIFQCNAAELWQFLKDTAEDDSRVLLLMEDGDHDVTAATVMAAARVTPAGTPEDQTTQSVPQHASMPSIEIEIPAVADLGIEYEGKPPVITSIDAGSPLEGEVKVGQIVWGVTAEGKPGLFNSDDAKLWLFLRDTSDQKGRVLVLKEETVVDQPTAGLVMAGGNNSARGRQVRLNESAEVSRSVSQAPNKDGGSGPDKLARSKSLSAVRRKGGGGIGQNMFKSFRHTDSQAAGKNAPNKPALTSQKSFKVEIPAIATDDLGIEFKGKPPEITNVDPNSPLVGKLKIGQIIIGLTAKGKKGLFNADEAELVLFLRDTSEINGRVFIVKENPDQRVETGSESVSAGMPAAPGRSRVREAGLNSDRSKSRRRNRSSMKSFNVDVPATDDLGIECEGKPPKITHVDPSSPLADKLKVGQIISGVTFANKPGFHSVDGAEMAQFLKDTSGEEGRIFIVKEERTDVGDHDVNLNRPPMPSIKVKIPATESLGITYNGKPPKLTRVHERSPIVDKVKVGQIVHGVTVEGKPGLFNPSAADLWHFLKDTAEDDSRVLILLEEGSVVDDSIREDRTAPSVMARSISMPIKVEIPASEDLGIEYDGKPPKISRVDETSPIVNEVKVGQIISGVTVEGKPGLFDTYDAELWQFLKDTSKDDGRVLILKEEIM